MDQQDIDKFVQAFNLEQYERHTILDDPLIGFSVVIECTDSLKKKLKIEKDKEYVTLMYVSIDREVADSIEKKKEVVLEANFVLELENGFNYNYNFIGCKKYVPINLITNNEYFYDIETRKFYNKDGGEIDAIKCLEEVYEMHTKPSDYFGGFFLRSRLGFKRMRAGFYNRLSKFFSKVHYLIYREKKEYEHPEFTRMMTQLGLVERQEPEKPKKKEAKEEKVDFFGFKNDPEIVFIFCIVHIGLYVIYQLKKLDIEIIRIFFNNTFLVVCYATAVLLLMKFTKFLLKKVIKFIFLSLVKNFIVFLIQETGKHSDAISYSKINI